MTFTITREFIYFVICGILLIMQVLQRRKIDKMRKDLDHVTNTLMLLMFGIKQSTDEKRQKED